MYDEDTPSGAKVRYVREGEEWLVVRRDGVIVDRASSLDQAKARVVEFGHSYEPGEDNLQPGWVAQPGDAPWDERFPFRS
ncbi:hypothetical protein FDO65_10255 [Nakamurella flava]|uniref:Uncharacterized protein n=1 Tax=Nakamurella flava TaxID=2576308 RepID=A0A4U6QMJ1_9ACTN|nr:hypothetical protein [Nakamurella flava]TKV61897.1 hypothetical protein FDO65_10255 [Nakamurella flava]